jgi:hypothetical protein
LDNVFDPTSPSGNSDGVSAVGSDIYFDFASSGGGYSYGAWAVTAP